MKSNKYAIIIMILSCGLMTLQAQLTKVADFETGDFSQAINLEPCGDKQGSCDCANGISIKVVSKEMGYPVRAGQYAAYHRLIDCHERAEVVEGTPGYDVDVWIGFSLYFPDNAQSREYNHIIMQFHDRYGGLSNKPPYCSGYSRGGPSLINVDGGEDGNVKLHIRYQDGSCMKTTSIAFGKKTNMYGKWTDFVVNARFVNNANGFYKIWMYEAGTKATGSDPGDPDLNYSGSTYHQYNNSGPAIRTGPYTGNPGRAPEPSFIMYSDEIRIGRESNGIGFWDVAPKGDFSVEKTAACFSVGSLVGISPMEVDFNASCSKDVTPGGISSYFWDFGDGSTATGMNVSHTYTTDSIYTPMLIVTEGAETDTATKTIWVGNIPEIIQNPGFEDSTAYWERYASTLTAVSNPVYGGTSALYVSERSTRSAGAKQDVTELLNASGPGVFNISAWLKMETGTAAMKIRLYLRDDSKGQSIYTNNTSVDTQWTAIDTSLTLSWTGELETATLYFRSDDEKTGFYLDDVSFKKDLEASSDVSPNFGQNLPGSFQLYQNYPNPFNGETIIRYRLSVMGRLQIDVYDISGHLVKQLFSGEQTSGDYEVMWDGRDQYGSYVSSGIYLCQLKTKSQRIMKKMMLIQ